jgi:hypothetical protein
MTGVPMHDRPTPLPPDLAEDAGPELAALLEAAAPALRSGPDPFTRARHLEAMAAARPPRRAELLTRSIGTAAVAAAAGVVALASAGLLPGPLQEVAGAMASRVGWELPTGDEAAVTPEGPSADGEPAGGATGDAADGGAVGTGPGPIGGGGEAELGQTDRGPRAHERSRPAAPGRDSQGAPDVPPGLANLPLDAWERIPAWLELRRDGLLPLPGHRGAASRDDENGAGERPGVERDRPDASPPTSSGAADRAGQPGGGPAADAPADRRPDRGATDERPTPGPREDVGGASPPGSPGSRDGLGQAGRHDGGR